LIKIRDCDNISDDDDGGVKVDDAVN